jgi:hypothetical protein
MAEAVNNVTRLSPEATASSAMQDLDLASANAYIRPGGCKSLTVGLLFAGNEAEAVVRLPRLRWCGRKAVE